MFDLILEHAHIIDGSGRPAYRADVGIMGDRIAAIGDLGTAEGRLRQDVEGRVVCPGFIDVHSHADLSLFSEDSARLLAPLVEQGITTFVGGNCGMGLAPIGSSNREGIKTYLEVFTQMVFERDVRWESLAGFMEHVEKAGALLNAALLVPHGLLRIAAAGMRDRPANGNDIDCMQSLLAESLEAGAFGLSTGLQYAPGSWSDTRELRQLAGTLKPFDGIFTSHLRSYTSTTLGQAIDEVAEVASTAGVHGHISHLFSIPWMGALHRPGLKVLKWLAAHAELAVKALPTPLLHLEMRRLLGRIERHISQGTHLTMDLMPTTAGFTHLLAFFPPWALTGSREEVLARLRDPLKRAAMLSDIEQGRPAWPHRGRSDWSLNIMRQLGWDAVTIMAVHTQKNRPLEGRRFTEIAAERGKHPFDVMCELLLEENGQVLVFESLGEPDDPFTEQYTLPAITDSGTMITTDTILLGMGRPSYLFYGCYPKFIGRYVTELGLIGLPEAIARCTSLPAREFGIAA